MSQVVSVGEVKVRSVEHLADHRHVNPVVGWNVTRKRSLAQTVEFVRNNFRPRDPPDVVTVDLPFIAKFSDHHQIALIDQTDAAQNSNNRTASFSSVNLFR